MQVEEADPRAAKRWYAGPWNSDLTVSIGYANEGIEEPHLHQRVTEIYMVAQGTSRLRVEQETVRLKAGDGMVIDPGETHTFLSSSPDYFHFVAHVPGLTGAEARDDKECMARSRLGL